MAISKKLFDHLGQPVRLGRQLGNKGGEGSVYEIETCPDLAAKIYDKAPTARLGAKLRAMIGAAPQELMRVAAWPQSTLHERPGGNAVGFVMRKLKEAKEIHTLYSPANRKIAFPDADWKFLITAAMNCAAAFEKVHSCGFVVGDVNQKNVFVSTNALISLLDCDSFQIQSNGQTYLCEVGVAEFTPPELQKRSFNGLTRTPNHDCFGLAVLIFHLLFMNRHPFSGRFLGKGDMPIPQAIAEYRFAYGRNARSYEMQTPMNALPLSALSLPLVELFERAFGEDASQDGLRPTAADWHGALKGFLQTLRSCSADPGHVYAAHLSSCPWCNLMKQGAPNFFISVTYFRQGKSQTDSVFVLAIVWARIEQIRSPDLTYRPPVVPQGGRPTPFPAGVPMPPDTLQRVVGYVAATNGLIFVPFLFCVKFIAVMALIAFFVFGTWWLVLEAMRAVAAIRTEAEKRRRANADAEQRFRASEMNWLAAASRQRNQFKAKKAELRTLRKRHESLPREYDAQRQNLQSRAREMQLLLFLQQHFLNNADIPDIGPTRKATLASFGIEMAADVEENAVLQVPGFGPKLTARLIHWRRGIEQQFVFDPTKGVPPQQWQALELKFAQDRRQIETKLLDGEKELQAIRNRAEGELRLLYGHIQSCLPALVQSQLDLTLIPRGL